MTFDRKLDLSAAKKIKAAKPATGGLLPRQIAAHEAAIAGVKRWEKKMDAAVAAVVRARKELQEFNRQCRYYERLKQRGGN